MKLTYFKQNRYSHVRLIENHEARVVVHWRYALTDVIYQIANTDPVTNWGDWPVSQIPCDGRFVLANDRVTSSAITSPEPIMRRRAENNVIEGRFIMGISDKTMLELIPYAKFWLSPPEIKIHNNQFSYDGFNKNDRAYHISKKDQAAKELRLCISASPASPLVNPVFVIENWGNHELECKVNNIVQTNEDRFRYVINKTLESKNLIIWLEMNSEENIDISMVPLEY